MRRKKRAWKLAETFDRLARTTVAGPDKKLTAAVAKSSDAEIRAELLMALDVLSNQDPEVARRYAEHLVRLAVLLPGFVQRGMLAGVDLILATVAADAQEWGEAVQRISRAGLDIHELLPGAVADWMWVSGRCCEHDGRINEARELWAQARHQLTQDERWFDAAKVSVALAVLSGAEDNGSDDRDPVASGGVERALADWGEAADLYLAAGELDLARDCATEAARFVTRIIRNMRTGAEPQMHALAIAARELALRHRAAELAAELACLAGATGPDAGRTLEETRSLFDAARDGYRTLQADPRETRIQLAWIDMVEAGTLIARGRFRAAEPLLHAAIQIYRAEAMTEAVTLCETMLTGLLAVGEHDMIRVSQIVAKQQWADEESLAGAAMLRGMALARFSRIAEALTEFAEASRLALAARLPHKAVGFNAMAAGIALMYGDRGPAERSVAEIECYLAGNPVTLPTSARELLSYLQLMLRAELAARDGDQDAQLAYLADLEEKLGSFGAGLLAALIALRRARVLLTQGQYSAALNTVLPAVLALDAVRFTLPDAERRSRWTPAVADGFDTTFRSAAACADKQLIAELIEVARGNAVPLARAAADGATGNRMDLAESLGDLLAHAGPDSTAGADRTMSPDIISGAGALVGVEGRTVLGLPAYLRTPWGTIALAEHLQLACRYHDPVRANIAVDWTVAPPAAGDRPPSSVPAIPA